MSGDKEQEYFSDGLSEELLNLLAAIPELQVTSRSSAFAFKGKDDDLRLIGEKLNVNADTVAAGYNVLLNRAPCDDAPIVAADPEVDRLAVHWDTPAAPCI